MAFSAVLTGTAQSVNGTNGNSVLSVSNTSGWLTGATLQGTGIPAGTRAGNIVANTSVQMVNASGAAVNFTGTTGAVNVIVSSKYGSTLTLSANASGDYATWSTVYNAGFGVAQGTRSLYFAGGLTIVWGSFVAGSVWDDLDWTIEFGAAGRWQFDEGLFLGEHRGGYLVNGTQFIKTAGPTYYYNSWNNNTAGGSSMFTNTGGLLTKGGLFRKHNPRYIERSGANASAAFASTRMEMVVENMILDWQADSAGANAGFGIAYGTLINTSIIKANSGLAKTNTTASGTISGLLYVGNYQSSPNHKFSLADGLTIDGYAPQVTSAQLLGGFQNNTTETYSNIDLKTAGWGLNDLKTKYQRYGGGNILKFPRRVTFKFKNNTGTQAITNVTLYIKSGATSVVNAVQLTDYDADTQALILNWPTTIISYRVCEGFIDTIDQVAQIRKYGYISQTAPYSLNLDKYSQQFNMSVQPSLVNITEAAAAALTTVGIDWVTQTITPTSNLTYDQINARIDYELALPVNSSKTDPRTIDGNELLLATGWTLVVNNGITINKGDIITYMYVPTITINTGGKITAVYGTTVGVSTTLSLRNVSAGAAYIVANNTNKNTVGYGVNNTSQAQDYTAYFPPGSNGVEILVARELYSYQRVEEVITIVPGEMWYSFVDVPDIGINVTNLFTVQNYQQIENADKLYDYTAVYRLTEEGIKLGQLVTRDGVNINVSQPYSIVIDQNSSSLILKDNNIIKVKASGYANGARYTNTVLVAPATLTAATNESITANFEDANGNSSLVILGGDGTYNLWKVPVATAAEDYETGTLLGTFGNVKYRFTGVSGFDIIGIDTTSGVRRRTSMSKGIYEQSFYVGDQIQLAQNSSVTKILEVVELLKVEIAGIKGENYTPNTGSLAVLADKSILTVEEIAQGVRNKIPEVAIIPALVHFK